MGEQATGAEVVHGGGAEEGGGGGVAAAGWHDYCPCGGANDAAAAAPVGVVEGGGGGGGGASGGAAWRQHLCAAPQPALQVAHVPRQRQRQPQEEDGEEDEGDDGQGLPGQQEVAGGGGEETADASALGWFGGGRGGRWVNGGHILVLLAPLRAGSNLVGLFRDAP